VGEAPRLLERLLRRRRTRAPSGTLPIEHGTAQGRGQLGRLLGGLVQAAGAELNAPALEQAEHAPAAGGEQSLDVTICGIPVTLEFRLRVRIVRFLWLHKQAVEGEHVERNIRVQGGAKNFA
jgi:hypothetical protein